MSSIPVIPLRETRGSIKKVKFGGILDSLDSLEINTKGVLEAFWST